MSDLCEVCGCDKSLTNDNHCPICVGTEQLSKGIRIVTTETVILEKILEELQEIKSYLAGFANDRR